VCDRREVTGGTGGGVVGLDQVNRQVDRVEELGLEGLGHFGRVLGGVVM